MRTIIVWHNIACDPTDRDRRAGYDGYQPGQPLMRVARYTVEDHDSTPSPVLADQAFRLFNVGDDPEFGVPDPRAVEYRKRGNRSLSKGDVVQVDTRWWACSSRGWLPIEPPTWVVLDTRGSGSLDRAPTGRNEEDMATATVHAGHFAPRDGATPRTFLDLKTKMITRNELARIKEVPPRVEDHEFGAWVHVPPAEADEDRLDADFDPVWADFPNVRAILIRAREMGAYWVNFDRDGYDTIDGFPTFDW